MMNWQESYHKDTVIYEAECQQAQEEFIEMQKYITDFELLLADAGITEGMLGYYLQYKKYQSPKHPRIDTPKQAWRLNIIDFRRYYSDSYKEHSLFIALNRWCLRKIIIMPQESEGIHKKFIQYYSGYAYKLFGKIPQTSFYYVRFGNEFYKFKLDEINIPKQQHIDIVFHVFLQAVNILNTETKKERDRRYSWACWSKKFKS